MPQENIVSPEQYIMDMQSAGFREIQIDDISNHVFPGFVRFLKQKGVLWFLFGHVVSILHRVGARFVIVTAHK